MSVKYKIYVPAGRTFENYFLPKVADPTLEHFEVDRGRRGIQRKGNNHLVVFLDYHGKKAPAHFSKVGKGKLEDFHSRTPEEAEIFNRVFGLQKEIGVFLLTYNAKMSALAWEFLSGALDDEEVVVEDESGRLLTGRTCAEELRWLLYGHRGKGKDGKGPGGVPT